MLKVLGSRRKTCAGFTRREAMQIGGLSLLGGFGLPQLLQAQEQRRRSRPGKAKSVIVLYLLGGAATQDMIDLKPDAPDGIRTDFRPIHTAAPGIQICEHMPRMARWTNKMAVVRSLNHRAGCHNTLPSYTGLEQPLLNIGVTSESFPPSMGSVCEYLRGDNGELPDYVYMPCHLGWGQAIRRPGPYGGFLGHRYDALTTECIPTGGKNAGKPGPGDPQTVLGEARLPDSTLAAEVTLDRLNSRRSLSGQLEDQLRSADVQPAVDNFNRNQRRAFNLLTSSEVRAAFDIEREDPRIRDRYGRTLFGNCTLTARRLIEAGVRFVNVTWDLFPNINYDCWDTHSKNFPTLKNVNLPELDRVQDALLQDLQDRGLLEETLVVVMSEMGRTPRVNANGGRDHWTFCYGMWFAGAGIRGGTVYGSSDAQAAYVRDLPVSTGDVCASIFECLGIDPDLQVPDRSGRPHHAANGGKPIREILT